MNGVAKATPLLALLAALWSLPAGGARAQDATAGETEFSRQCVACHVIRTPSGETVAGRNALTGPNLWGMVGARVGGVDGFRYGTGMAEMAARGRTWDEASIAAYLQDPTGWLQRELGDRRARGKMAYMVRDAGQAADIAAYLATLGD